MLRLIGVVVAFGVTAGPAAAQSWSPLETTDQARARHSAENYQYQQRYGTPLGGYADRLGDPAPAGTLRPGYTSPTPGYGTGRGYDNNPYSPSSGYSPYESTRRRY